MGKANLTGSGVAVTFFPRGKDAECFPERARLIRGGLTPHFVVKYRVHVQTPYIVKS